MAERAGFAKFALTYGLRSLSRNKKRTVLVVSTVALSTLVSIVGMSYATAVIKIWAQGAIDFGLGHAQIHTRAYWDNPDVLRENHLIRDDAQSVKDVLADPAVKAASRRIKFEGTISVSNKSVYFLGVAVSPESELSVAPKVFSSSDQGKFLSNDEPNGVVLGRALAENLNLKVGDSCSLMTITLGGNSNATDVIVRGIVDTPLPSMSKRLVMMNLDNAQKALRLPGVFTEMAVLLKDDRTLDAWNGARKERMFAEGLDLRTWYQIDPIIRRVEKIGHSLIAFMCFLLFVSSGISVANIVYLLVAERTVEIGTLMALGAKPSAIKRLFVFEASLIAAFGGFGGVFVGVLAIFAMDAIGIPFKSPFHSGLLEIHPKVDVALTAAVTAVALLICYAAALLPSRTAAKVEPVVAFRGQL